MNRDERWSDLVKLVGAAFIRHAIDNNGLLTSPRRAPRVAEQICQAAAQFVTGAADDAEIMTTTMQLAEQGLALVTGTAMMHALGRTTWSKTVDFSRLSDFQLRFLEKLAENREYIHKKVQERSQLALQQALHNQLEQQRRLHEAQEQRNNTLNQVLQLNAHLVPITHEPELLAEAVSGICHALNLADVTIYEYKTIDSHWITRTTTVTDRHLGQAANPQVAALLNAALSGSGEIINRSPAEHRKESVTLALILRLDENKLCGLVTNSESLDDYSYEEFPILIRTFAQNLSALWRNLLLFTETRQRARELEILHGRYVDAIWNSETAVLQAEFSDNTLHINRNSQGRSTFTPENRSVSIQVGDHPFGQVKFPPDRRLNKTDAAFAQALIREMSNALNNAHLLQTARSFSNQLSLAAEVSRAATTILDRAQLIQEVVKLIRARFDYYYVGLFLVDETGKTVVLHAGTGEAGRQQIAAGHKLPLNGQSMVSVAIGTGQAHAEQDVRLAKAFHRNPLLPDTRAELTVPLRTRGIIIGALTIQSNKTGVFPQETIDVLQALSDQFAVAIVNAKLFARVQDNLDETNRLYETSRNINAAQTAVDVYQALIDFARASRLADTAYIVCADPDAPDYFITPVLWSRTPSRHNPRDRFPRDKFHFGEQLSPNKLARIRDSQTDPRLGRLARRLARANHLHALALIPIQVEGEWLATLALQRADPHSFTETELKPFLTLVDQSAVILSNQQLLKQAETLYQVGQSLSQALTRDDAFDIAVQQVGKYTAAAQCRFVLYDAQAGTGAIMAEYHPTALAKTVRFPLGDFVFEHLSQKLTPLFLEEYVDIPASCIEQYVHQFNAKATLLIPATSQHELIGFLAIDSHREKRPFTQANTIFAQTVVDHLTTQIENLNLLEEALSRAQDLITLNQIQSGVSGILDLSELAQTVYDQVGRLLDTTIFILARYQASTNEYRPLLYVHKNQTVPGAIQKIANDEPLHQLLMGQRPLVTDQDHPIMEKALIPGLEQPVQSSLWIPLWHDNQPTGLISVQSYEPRRYSETDVQLLRSIATHTNLAIANAQLFEEIQASNAQLRQLDYLKTQFLANMSHELRTPLNSIIGFSRVVLKGIDGPLTPAQEEDLTMIYDNGQHLLALINEILDMAKIEAGKMSVSFEEIDLAHTAHLVLETTRSLVDKTQVRLIDDIVADLPHIEADPVRLRQILNNLLSNAAKFTNEGHIRLLVQQQGTDVHIAVEDTGIGIREQDYEALFRPFEQIKNRDSRVVGGTGLGLPITRWLVSTHNGRIWLESQPQQGTTFHILLPIHQPANSPTEVSLSESPLAFNSLAAKP